MKEIEREEALSSQTLQEAAAAAQKERAAQRAAAGLTRQDSERLEASGGDEHHEHEGHHDGHEDHSPETSQVRDAGDRV